MADVKSILASKTIWGAAMAVLGGVLGFLGFTVNAEDQAALVNQVPEILAGIGGIIAIWGRIVASKKIG